MFEDYGGVVLIPDSKTKDNFILIDNIRYYAKELDMISVVIESVASFVFNNLNNKGILYKIGKREDKYFSVSPDFIKDNQVMLMYDLCENISNYKIRNNLSLRAESGDLEAIKKIIEFINPEIFEDFMKMFIADMFILNEDRHANNFGLLSNNCKEIMAIPPFDFDLSLGELEQIYIKKDLNLKKENIKIYSRVGLFHHFMDRSGYPFMDLIRFCLKLDLEFGNRDYRDLIENNCDMMNPFLLIRQYELLMNIEINYDIKIIMAQILKIRKDSIWTCSKKTEKSLSLRIR